MHRGPDMLKLEVGWRGQRCTGGSGCRARTARVSMSELGMGDRLRVVHKLHAQGSAPIPMGGSAS